MFQLVTFAMFVMGLVAILRRQISPWRGAVITGKPAVMIGAVLLICMPVTTLLAVCMIPYTNDPTVVGDRAQLQLAYANSAITVGCGIGCLVIAMLANRNTSTDR